MLTTTSPGPPERARPACASHPKTPPRPPIPAAGTACPRFLISPRPGCQIPAPHYSRLKPIRLTVQNPLRPGRSSPYEYATDGYAISPPSASIPKGLCHLAQGCEARATLGNRPKIVSNPNRGCAPSPAPSTLSMPVGVSSMSPFPRPEPRA